MRNVKYLTGIGAALTAMVTSIVFGGVASAQTQPTQGPALPNGPVSVVGMVQSVSQSSLTLTVRRGTVTVNVGANTWIVVERDSGCAEGTLQDVQANKVAVVAGVSSGQSTISARMILQGRCQGMQGVAKAREAVHKLAQHAAQGTIKAINGSTITLAAQRANDWEITVNTTADTAVLNNGFSTVSTLKVGDKVQVFGSPQKVDRTAKSRTLNAWGLRVESANTRLAAGRVESVSGNTVTLTTPRGNLTVTLDAGAGYRSGTISRDGLKLGAATQADVKVGTHLLVEGVSTADSKGVNAKSVIIFAGGVQKTRPARP